MTPDVAHQMLLALVEHALKTGDPIPVDMEARLLARGIDVESLRKKYS